MLWQARRGLIYPKAAFDPAPAPSGSGWGDHGTFINLSTTTIANDTATLNISSNNWSTVRGTQGYSAGKRYFEVKVLTAPGGSNFDIGLLDATTANGAGLDDRFPANLSAHYGNNGTAQTSGSGMTGVNIGSGWTTNNNDILGIALDADNGFHYLALNNVWFLGGDPTSGGAGTGHVAAYSPVLTYYPAISLWGLVNGVMQLKTSGLTFSPPSGYSAWG